MAVIGFVSEFITKGRAFGLIRQVVGMSGYRMGCGLGLFGRRG